MCKSGWPHDITRRRSSQQITNHHGLCFLEISVLEELGEGDALAGILLEQGKEEMLGSFGYGRFRGELKWTGSFDYLYQVDVVLSAIGRLSVEHFIHDCADAP